MRPAWIVPALVLVSALAASAKDVTVKVGHGGFEPARIEVARGDKVVFSNTVEMPGGHTVVAEDGSFSSPPLRKDETWSHTFDKPGTYKIHVKEHPGAGGEVVVK